MRDVGYLKYAEVESFLRRLVMDFPQLASLDTAGKSFEGRELWVLTLTNSATGAADTKPAMYIEGNMHAGEVTGSAVCLYTAAYLCEQYGHDAEATHLLDTRTFYILPRVSPDGAELYLTTPLTTRSGVRRYPPEQPREGLVAEDIDGDGLILQMRIADPQGEWKVSQRDHRCMIKRRPGETGGQYYRIVPEGMIRNADGTLRQDADLRATRVAPPYCGLDFNRNYPANWQPEVVQRGAGPYPLSEPETRAVADFLLGHPNIVAAMSYHTSGGVILRPFSTKSDQHFDERDLELYRHLGEVGRQTAGYDLISVYGGLNGDKPSHGDFKDWAYEQRGLIVFTTELWNLRERAGIDLDWTADYGEEEYLKLFAWNDRELAGSGWVDWHPYAHPQLGQVELGGWRTKEMMQNPPLTLLPEECHKNMLFTLRVAGLTPEIAIDDVTVRPVGVDVYRVEAAVCNRGYLPSNGCDQALKAGVARTVTAVFRPATGTTVIGESAIDLGHMAGHSTRLVGWTITAPGGAAAAGVLEVGAPRCGTVRVSVTSRA